MERRFDSAVSAGIGDYSDMRRYVEYRLASMEANESSEPAAWKPFADSSPRQLDTCKVLATYVVADAAHWNIRPPVIGDREVAGWRQFAEVTPEQVRCFGELATGYCAMVDQSAAAAAMNAYLEEHIDRVWADER